MPRLKRSNYLAAKIYLLDLPNTDLSAFDGLIIPEDLNQSKLDAAAPQLLDYLANKGTVFLFGDQPTEWLSGVKWHFAVANLPDPDNLCPVNTDHPFHTAFKPTDFFHQHGYFDPPQGAEILMTKNNGDVVFYIDQFSANERLVVTCR